MAASAPLGQMENCQRLNSLKSDESALHQNINKKGENAYYHAHSREFEIPANAKIISGPGLVTGGSPEKLNQVDASTEIDMEKIVWIKEYSWADADSKVKVYVPCEGLTDSSIVKADFDKRSVLLDIAGEPRRKLRLQRLNAEIDTEESKVRVELGKARVTLVLVKKKQDSVWRDLLCGK